MGKSDVRCPKCGKATNGVELIYPRTNEQEERRIKAFMCENCLYVFSESDVENTNNDLEMKMEKDEELAKELLELTRKFRANAMRTKKLSPEEAADELIVLINIVNRVYTIVAQLLTEKF